MLELKIQCEHCVNGVDYSWFSIAEWRSGIHSIRQLISLCERYHRVKDILARIPEQSKASGSTVDRVTTARGIGWRAKHSCYAGITGVRLIAGNELIGQWRKRDDTPEPITPDVSIMSNRQIAALGAGYVPDKAAAVLDTLLTPSIEGMTDATQATFTPKPPSQPPPKRRIIDAPQPTRRKSKTGKATAP